jgi:hypothetical protein
MPVAVDHGAEKQSQHRQTDEFKSGHFNLPELKIFLLLWVV